MRSRRPLNPQTPLRKQHLTRQAHLNINLTEHSLIDHEQRHRRRGLDELFLVEERSVSGVAEGERRPPDLGGGFVAPDAGAGRGGGDVVQDGDDGAEDGGGGEVVAEAGAADVDADVEDLEPGGGGGGIGCVRGLICRWGRWGDVLLLLGERVADLDAACVDAIPRDPELHAREAIALYQELQAFGKSPQRQAPRDGVCVRGREHLDRYI